MHSRKQAHTRTHTQPYTRIQALESECIVPLCLAGEHTKVVLAGDHMQMDPPVYSSIARKYGLHVSLLERLYDHEAYVSGMGLLCKTLLTENHRSHQQACACVNMCVHGCVNVHFLPCRSWSYPLDYSTITR